VVALPAELNSVIYCAATALIGAKAALRLMVDPSKLPLLGGLQGLSGIRLNRAERHAHLALTPTFDEFLAKLGPHTRRNFRSFRRKSEQAGNEFIAELPYAEFCAAARALVPNANYSENTTNFERCLAMIGTMPSRITAGLRDRNGKLISVAGGFHDGRRGIMVMQLNDRSLPRASLSLVLRSYLIENLIDRGFEEFVFWAGSSAPLSEYCVSPELWIAHIDSRAIRWRVARVVGAIVGRLAPRASRRWIKWIVPDTDSEHQGAKLE
jgi:Acetyltransferase (GNAT) domain